MRKLEKALKYVYNKTPLGKYLEPARRVYDLIRPEKQFIIETYKELIGSYPNIENPRSFTEKVQWLKLNARTELKTICADKYKVREHVKNKIGEEYLIPLILETKKVRDINAHNLPAHPVIIKVNHDSGGGIIVKDKKNVNFDAIQNELRKRLKRNYYYRLREWEYKNIDKRIIVEKLMQDNSGNDLLSDYKFFCFNGEPMYIQTVFDREAGIKETWYNLHWEAQDFWCFSSEKKYDKKPASLNEMIKIARRLSEDFRFVRIDLYEINNKPFFGEMTFHPYAGFMKWHPKEWDNKLGDLLNL